MKIEVGDTVARKDGKNFSHGEKTATVEKVDHIGVWFEETGTQLCSDKLIKYQPSPIRTVTRREIVAGTYGRLYVEPSTATKRVNINFNDEDGKIFAKGLNCYLGASELRESAHILNQIAEALEENEK